MANEVEKVKVKGIKYGTWARYDAISPKDPDTLYFITDKGGTIYRGSQLVIPKNVIETVSNTLTAAVGDVSISGQLSPGEQGKQIHNFEIEAFVVNASGSTSSPSAPTKFTFAVYSTEAVNAVSNVLYGILQTHRTIDSNTMADGKGTDTNYGHVQLTDSVDMTGVNNPAAAAGGKAVTPKGVYDAISAAIGGIGGAMVFKGTIGAAAQNPTVTSLPTNSYGAGWTYKVVTAGTYAGQVCEIGDLIISVNNGPATGSTVIDADWTVAQTNIDGAVTADAALDQNTLVLGDGNKTVKKLENGNNGTWLRIVNGVPTWVTHPNVDHGIAKCECVTDFASVTSAGAATLVDSNAGTYVLVSGAIVAVKFTNPVTNKNGDVTLNVASTGAKLVYFRGAKITEGIISAGDTATLMYNGTYWDVLAIDKHLSNVAVSGDYDDLIHKPIQYATNSQNADVLARTLTISDYTEISGNSKILAVTFTNGIVYDTAGNPTLSVNGGTAQNIKWHGANVTSGMILPGDTVMMINSGTSYDIVGLNRKIDAVPTQNSHNLVESGGVYAAIQAAVDAAALWWEPNQSINTVNG